MHEELSVITGIALLKRVTVHINRGPIENCEHKYCVDIIHSRRDRGSNPKIPVAGWVCSLLHHHDTANSMYIYI